MDFEAPPPFTGALEEPPDLECDMRLTVDDDDDDVVQPPDIPVDVPCTSSPPLSPCRSPVTKRKPSDVASASRSRRTTIDDNLHPVLNGMPENTGNCVLLKKKSFLLYGVLFRIADNSQM